MNFERLNIKTAQFKTDPKVAIDIAYRVCERYYEMGCPETKFDHDKDDWYTEGALSGGQIAYGVNGLDADNEPVYEYVEKHGSDALEDGAEASLSIIWGRANLMGPGRIKVRVDYPEQWVPVKGIGSIFASSFEREFVPANIKSTTIPHFSANRCQMFEWINEYVDSPRDATAAPGVKFFAGEEGIKQIKSEILNLLISGGEADIVSPTYIGSRFQISFEYAFNLLEELEREGKIVRLDVPERYFEATRLYGSAAEWNDHDAIPKDDDLLVRYHG